MKPSTYTETVEIVRAWMSGTLKDWLTRHHVAPSCARMRIMRFRKQYPAKYRKLENVTFC